MLRSYVGRYFMILICTYADADKKKKTFVSLVLVVVSRKTPSSLLLSASFSSAPSHEIVFCIRNRLPSQINDQRGSVVDV